MTPATIHKLAETKSGVLLNPTYVAMMGAMRPQIRLAAAAMPHPVPRCTEGITSGV